MRLKRWKERAELGKRKKRLLDADLGCAELELSYRLQVLESKLRLFEAYREPRGSNIR